MSEVKRFRFVDTNGYPAIMVCDSVKAERFVEEQEYDRLAVALEAESKGSDRAAEAMLAWKRDFDRVTAEREALQALLTAADEALDKAADDYAILSLEAGQRMGLLEGLLREVVALDPRGEFLGWQLDGRIDEVLQRAEVVGDE